MSNKKIRVGRQFTDKFGVREFLKVTKRTNMAKNTSTNPALKDLKVLVGNWDMELSNASFLSDPKATIRGTTSIEWIEGGDLLVMRQGKKGAGPNYAMWVIGRDADSSEYVVLYSDDRGVSRVYQMSFNNGVLKIWRNSPKFSQRYVAKISKDKKTIKAYWEKSLDGKKWDHDFDIIYKRN